MKKTLVALAAIAATGGAFAQATMTGTVGFAWYQSVATDGTTASGFGADTNHIDFAISEDLDGGAKLTAAVGIDMGTASGAATASRDLVLAIKTASTGTFTMKNAKGGDYLSNGIAAVGSDYENDNTGTSGVFSTRAEQDSFGWSFPLTSELTLSATYTEPVTDAGAGAGASGSALDSTANYAEYQRYMQYSLTYKSGPLVVDGGYRSYDQANAQTTNASSRNRGSFSYDLGAAKVGAGWSQTSYNYGNTATDTLVGLAIPMGQLTLSGQLGNRTKSGNLLSSKDTNYSSKIVNAVYSLSKRTDLFAGYKTWDVSSAATSTPTTYWAGIYHSF